MEATYDITDINVRKQIIKEIEGQENLRRKEESYRNFEIYRDRQAKYILDRLAGETSAASIRDMRTVTSINLTKKMIHELASIYKYEAERDFTDLNDLQKQTMLAHYKYSRADVEFKQSNRMYKLHEQCALKIVPKNGFLSYDVLQPHHYDCVPSKLDPEHGEIYIISSFDRSRVVNQNDFRELEAQNAYENRTFMSDGVNQKIGDQDDWDMKNKPYYWWSAEYNFKTNGKGEIIDDKMKPLPEVDFEQYKNQIETLPFVDIATEKDYEYWVRAGGSITDFNIDFGVQLSDNVNINRLQGFSQAVITSVEKPKDIYVGPHSVIWLKVDPKDETAQRPEFQFVTPSPDLNASMGLSEGLLKYFLVSKSINIKGMLEGTANATSGIERLLMMIEKFEASQDDLDLFRMTEQSAYEIMVKWHNVFNQVRDGLNKKVQGPQIPEDSEVQVKFGRPDLLQSKQDKVDGLIKELDAGLLTPVEALMELREVDEATAEKIYKKIKKFEMMDVNQLQQAAVDMGMDSPDDELQSDEEK